MKVIHKKKSKRLIFRVKTQILCLDTGRGYYEHIYVYLNENEYDKTKGADKKWQ